MPTTGEGQRTQRDTVEAMPPLGPTDEQGRAAEAALEQKRGSIENLFSAGNAAAAQSMVKAELATARSLRRNDPRRADALALQLCLLQLENNFRRAVRVAAEIVEIRKAAKPPDFARLAMAYSSFALALFSAERYAAGDAALSDSRKAWRKAYGPNDPRLAGIIKTQADFVGKADCLNRPRQAIELLKEAAGIRERAKDGAPESLADILHSLALFEMRVGDLTDADKHLAKTADILSAEVKRQAVEERANVLRAGFIQVLVMRAQIAIADGNLSEAEALIDKAQAEPTAGSDSIEQELLLAKLHGNIAEWQGKADAALGQSSRQLELARQIVPADDWLVGDVEEAIGDQFRNRYALDDAAEHFLKAISLRGGPGSDTAPVLLKLADIGERTGRADAESLYRRGLDLRKGTISEVSILFGTNRGPIPDWDGRFDITVAESITYGEALVLVPGGPFSTDALRKRRQDLAFAAATDAERLITRKPKTLDKAAFAGAVTQRSRRTSLYPEAALIFVHGYANNFEFALARLAQLVRDLNFDGPAFAFSWPSEGVNAVASYKADQVRARKSVKSLVSFIKEAATTSMASKIHIIAHSMGNEVLLGALTKLIEEASSEDLCGRIGEVVFASPDVAQSDFRRQIEALGQFHMTLYASRHDRALWISRFVNLNAVRAGFVASGIPIIVGGVESIDVSQGGDDLLQTNHNIYSDNPIVTDDLRKLLQKGSHPPSDRTALFETCRDKHGARYWYYRRPIAG